MMGHISNTGYNSQFHQVWGAESLRNDFRDDSNSSSSNNSSSYYGVSTGSRSTGLFGSHNREASRASTHNRRSSNNASIFDAGLSSGGQQNSVENIWGPSTF